MPPQTHRPPPIDEIVGFLHSRAPERLDDLRSRFPSLKEELKAGIIAGDSPDVLTSRAKIAADGVAEMLEQSAAVMTGLERRMRSVRRLRLVGQLCTALGSATVVGFLLGKLPNPAIGSGIITLIGSVSVICVDHLGAVGSVKIFDHYITLREIRHEAKRVQEELKLRLGRPESDRDTAVLDQLVRDANDLAKKIDKAIGQTAG